MKKIILSAAIIALTSVAFAQTAPATPQQATETTVAQDSSSSTPVKLEDLPESVKTALSSDAYKTWTPTEAFLIKENGNEYYLINVMQEDKKASVKIKADGTPVSEEK